jgi:leader peptidase (prepilin peptidase)/N-methyltransferase
LLVHRILRTAILGPITVLASALCAALGAAFGSFVGLCLDRIPRRESLWRPGSHCRSCKTGLKVADLVPVFSYVQRRGRCAYCGEPVDARLLGIELAGAAALGALPLWLGARGGALAALGIVAVGIVTALLAARLAPLR